jgi:putative ABC transport system substrate-binding protein
MRHAFQLCGLVLREGSRGRAASGEASLTGPLVQKRLEFLRVLIPGAANITMLVNPTSPDAPPEIRDAEAATQANGLQIKLLSAATTNEIDIAFASLADARPDALVVGSDVFFAAGNEQFAAQTATTKIPTIYPFNEFIAPGGLISYGTRIANAYRLASIYAGRILKGEKPANLPVQAPTNYELAINLKTAKALGPIVPPSVLARADEVIE